MFSLSFTREVEKCSRWKNYLLKDYKEWLDQTLVFSNEIEKFLDQHCIIETDDPAMSDDVDKDHN